MRSEQHHSPLYDVKLASSASWVPSGHSVSLSWDVQGSSGMRPNAQLAWAGETGLEVIEAVPVQGVRQILFTRPDTYTFTLTATFGDGVKLSKKVRIHVLDDWNNGGLR